MVFADFKFNLAKPLPTALLFGFLSAENKLNIIYFYFSLSTNKDEKSKVDFLSALLFDLIIKILFCHIRLFYC
ncbi:MAG: hypothetical protein K5917_03080 [Clostridiales bacterium]|nr:hypothetical protein [Clostridiales bacterium]